VAVERIVLAPGDPWREAAKRAGAILRAGGVALLPTEGVYGLHVVASDLAAVERLHAIKPRDGKTGFIGLIGDPDDVARWAETGPRADAIIHQHWPGALTVVLRALHDVPPSMRSADGTIALRCPGNPFLRAAVQNATGLVISTSANEPGKPPMVLPEGFPGVVADLIVDQGTLSGIASTIVSVQEDRVTVLRQGAVSIAT
jgi:tRNA threonylcarbamoyl adenosine modification protein (Sua5/YciO/YrdC/YwlC family)